ncbi:MAG: T9SS type A sorting domain-containing protein [Elusimicrobia bacterium]|nr:T9SS type A sorting domain-containing protein [Elusimicrobiota bacterium]
MKQRIASVMILFIVVALFSIVNAAVDEVSVIISPKPDSYYVGTLTSGSDGNLYICATLNGVKGIYRITTSGELTLLAENLYSNSLFPDNTGKYLYMINGVETIKKISIEDGTVSDTISLTPAFDSFIVGTGVVGSSGDLYLAGTVDGNKAVYKIDKEGNVTEFSSEYGQIFLDFNKNIYIKKSNSLIKKSLDTGETLDKVGISPEFDSFLVGSMVLCADENFYIGGNVNGEKGIYKIQPDGSASLFSTEYVKTTTDFEKKSIYFVKSSTITSSSSGLSKVIYFSEEDTTGKEVFLTRYNVVVDKISVPQGDVKILGGAEGYVNPSNGETSTVIFKANKSGKVTVKIFTLSGQLVWEDSKDTDGTKDYIEWACKNAGGEIVSSDVYIVKVDGPGIDETKKVVIMR